MTALAGLSAHGRHHRPPLRKRLLVRARRRPQWPGWLLNWAWHRQATPYTVGTRRQRRAVEDARDEAYVVKIEAHAVPPLAEAQAALTALYNVLHHEHGFIVPPLTDGFNVPPAAVLDDVEDRRWPHLNRQWSDSTGSFPKIIGDQS